MTSHCTDSTFNRIDDSLKKYYEQNGHSNYQDQDGIGRFKRYIINEQLNDPDVPIENELGSDCDPTDCAYSWMDTDSNSPFPIPPNIQIPEEHIDEYIFYILQYCYKHNTSPSTQYIIENILSKVNGVFIDTSKLLQTEHAQHTFMSEEPEVERKTDNNTDEGATNESIFIIKRVSKKEFEPKYASRAHLNIYTAKDLTIALLNMIAEPFQNEIYLYYYTDISAALQMNDHQVDEYTVSINGEEHKFGIINYDFHCKHRPNEILYGVFVPNDDSKIQQDKWLWKLDEFLTAQQIHHKYDVIASELPLSSRKMLKFQQQLEYKLVIHEKLMDDTDWFGVPQIKSLKRNVKIAKVSVTLSKEMWTKECKRSFQNIDLPLIPVVVNKSNKHWIEWIKIINVESQNIYVGISCKYIEVNNEWKVQAICLDRGDIYNKHRLVGLIDDKYTEQLTNFKTSITEIIFSDNAANDLEKKINVLKQQITSQQDSIVRLKESILRVKNKNKYVQHTGHNMIGSTYNNNDNIPAPTMSQQIAVLLEEDEKDNGEDTIDPLSQIVDDVIKKYNVLLFRTNPIGAKRNIYINKQFTKSWMNYVFPRFSDEAMMYYWLDYTTAIQMIQGNAKQFVDKQSGLLLCCIINYELRNNQGNTLYGIIFADDTKDINNDKYPYKLATLMTKEQIHADFGINAYDLPNKSRKHNEFISKLILKRKILKQDLNQIRWANIQLFKSQSNNSDPLNKSVTITRNVMKEYIAISTERMNNTDSKSARNNARNLIPIMVIDKHNNSYGIEWVLIVHIIHRNCYVGVSFRYNVSKNLFVASSIYLDKGEIESKHKLIGLQYNYCQNIPSFSLKKLKFKADKYAFIDDDDDIAVHNKSNDSNIIVETQAATLKYKQLLENEQLKRQHLQQQIAQAHQAYTQQIESIKHQNGQYLIQQQSAYYNMNNPHQQIVYQQESAYYNNMNNQWNGY